MHLLLASRWDPSGHCFVYGSQLLPLWVAGLAAAGVPDGFVTTETYFNHKAEADADVVGAIAAAVALGRVDAAPPTEGPVTFLEGGVMP